MIPETSRLLPDLTRNERTSQARSRRVSKDSTFLTAAAGSVDSNGVPHGEPEWLPGGEDPRGRMQDVLPKLKEKFGHEQEADRFAQVWMMPQCTELLLAFSWHAVVTHVHPNEAQV